ncbi:MAG: chain length determinant protein EpsF [Methylophilaceae bacterium]
MNLLQFILIVRARYKIISLIFLATVLTTLVLSLIAQKSYTATASVMLSSKGIDPVTGSTLPAELMPSYMETQVDIINSHDLAVKVVDKLGIAQNPQAQEQYKKLKAKTGTIRDWYADLLNHNLNVKPSRGSNVIELSYSSPDPEFSATAANAFAKAYQDTSLQIKTAPAQSASNYLNSQTKVLRDNLEQAQIRLSKYQQENGITSGVEQADVENTRLNELTAQLVMAQSQSIDAATRQSGISGNAEQSPDIAANPMLQNLKVEIVRTESKLADISERLGVNHPQYQSAKAELDKLKSQYQQIMQTIVVSIGGSARNNEQRVKELTEQVAIQKTKVLTLNRLRDQLSLLQKDVDSAQRGLEAVHQRFTQTNLESQGNQTDISILNSAIAPHEPSSPKVKLNLLLAIFLGTLLGVGCGLLKEMLDRRVRSAEDLLEVIGVPVLGVIVSEEKKQLLLSKLPLLQLSDSSVINGSN